MICNCLLFYSGAYRHSVCTCGTLHTLRFPCSCECTINMTAHTCLRSGCFKVPLLPGPGVVFPHMYSVDDTRTSLAEPFGIPCAWAPWAIIPHVSSTSDPQCPSHGLEDRRSCNRRMPWGKWDMCWGSLEKEYCVCVFVYYIVYVYYKYYKRSHYKIFTNLCISELCMCISKIYITYAKSAKSREQLVFFTFGIKIKLPYNLVCLSGVLSERGGVCQNAHLAHPTYPELPWTRGLSGG